MGKSTSSSMAGMLFKRHDLHGFTAAEMEDTLADDDDMDNGTISVEHIPVVYWEFVGAVIAAFALWYCYELFICRQRLRAASTGKSMPARPKNIVTRGIATVSATVREVSNATPPNIKLGSISYPSPPFGTYAIAIANATLLIVLCFYKFDTTDIRNYQHIAYRAGFISLGQLPLLFLLSSKWSILGLVIGYSYERLNWLHRWVARCLLLTTTIHLGYWFGDWAPFGYTSTQVKADYTTQTGLCAWCILVWIVFSSFAPIRDWNYEFFVLQHLVSFIAFIVMILLHTPTSDHVWIWIGVALFAFDRVVRAISMIPTYVSCFSARRQRRSGSSFGSWACRGHVEPLAFGMTRVSIPNPPFTWRAGQHTFVSCHSIVPLQAHPFTITSIPSDGKLEFLIRARRGGTKQMYQYAEKQEALPLIEDVRSRMTIPVSLQGPYGCMRPLRQFDSVVLLAGGVGSSFVIPLMRDIVQRLKCRKERSGLRGWLFPCGVATRHIRLVWVIKSKEQLSWHIKRISDSLNDVSTLRYEEGLDISLQVSIYVTCDSTFSCEYTSPSEAQSQQLTDPPAAATPRLLDDVEKSAETVNASCCDKSTQKAKQNLEVNCVREVDPRSEARKRKFKTCQPDGNCCCQTTIKSEAANRIDDAAVCRCNISDDGDRISSCSRHASRAGLDVLESKNDKSSSCCDSQEKATIHEDSQLFVHPACMILSGRPHPKTIIRRTLEQAQGESAVVVCGPRGMITDVRRTVVALSDERAVHKGTGAQGIFFWGEGFAW